MEVLRSMPEQFPLPQSYPNSIAQLLKLWNMTYMGVLRQNAQEHKRRPGNSKVFLKADNQTGTQNKKCVNQKHFRPAHLC